MKKVIFLLWLLPLQAYCQVFEDFEPWNPSGWFFSSDGRWAADASSISGKYSLHHIFDNPEAGTDQAGIPVKNLHPLEDTVSWSFLVKHGCDPSSSNNWGVLLMSDSDPQRMIPGGGMRGYCAGVNITGSDDTLRLWKVDGASILPVITSKINWQADIGINNPLRISVSRTPSGVWVMSASGAAGENVKTSSGTESQLFRCEWFGLFYRYSSTRDRLFWFDDLKITGSFYDDVTPPSVTSVRIAGRSNLEITFSETPAASSLNNDNITINGSKIKSIIQKSSVAYRVSSEESFNNKETNTLQLANICDEAGNCCDPSIVTFTPVFPEAGDVVITEIMADPEPVVSLPGCEYIEVTNRTNFSYNLKDWKLEAGSRSITLPEVDFQSGSRLILCEISDTELFADYGTVLGIKSFPSLNDAGMAISMSDSIGNLIHGIEYSRDWYGHQLKSAGGWSLEMIDEDYPFFEEGNWTASGSRKGGTPGNPNSVSETNRDEIFCGLINVFPESPFVINAFFSEYIPDIQDLKNFSLDNGTEIKNISVSDRLHKSFIIETGQPLQAGIVYRLGISAGITDFAGNLIGRNTFDFGLPVQAEPEDILFNELLFNPLPGDPDFIEFFNNSGKIVDASRLDVASVNVSGETSEVIRLSEDPRCILPYTFYVITTDRDKTIQRYFTGDPDQIFEIDGLPSMNDDKGHLVLFNRELDRIDEVLYDDKMHYSLLESTEGISLERVSPGSSSVSNLTWHSASESSGWATPGKANSVMTGGSPAAEEVSLSSAKISPDNDGFEDVLAINFDTGENGNVLTITIFDERGSLVRKLVTRLLAGPHEELIWDGTADDGTLVENGIYIVFCEMYNASGKVRKWKKVCAVGR